MKAKLENLVQRTELTTAFDLPPPGWLKANAKEGDFVKVIASGERFWCRLLEDVTDEDTFMMQVSNDLVNTDLHGLYDGSVLIGRRENVFQFDAKKSA
jgi:hypothetical protein